MGCGSGRAPIASCDQDLSGVWEAGDGKRWMILDEGHALEGYPMFDDFSGSATFAAPRAFDLTRPTVAGEMRRRFTTGGEQCFATAPMHVTACVDNTLDVVVGDPICGRRADTHVEHWRLLQ